MTSQKTSLKPSIVKVGRIIGLPEAQYQYGLFLEEHRTDKRSETLKWWEKAAAGQNKDAQCELAKRLIHDPKKVDMAIDLFKQAHCNGSVDATRLLGWMYLNGKYLKPDPNKAAEHLGIAMAHDAEPHQHLHYGIASAWNMLNDTTGKYAHRLWKAAKMGHGAALINATMAMQTHIIQSNHSNKTIRSWRRIISTFDQLDQLAPQSLFLLSQRAGVDLIMQATPSKTLRDAFVAHADPMTVETIQKASLSTRIIRYAASE